MATTKTRAPKQKKIKLAGRSHKVIDVGSKEHENLLQAGYEMSIEDARTIVAERATNPELWPYEVFKKAQALILAYETKSKPVSKQKHWKRRRR